MSKAQISPDITWMLGASQTRLVMINNGFNQSISEFPYLVQHGNLDQQFSEARFRFFFSGDSGEEGLNKV